MLSFLSAMLLYIKGDVDATNWQRHFALHCHRFAYLRTNLGSICHNNNNSTILRNRYDQNWKEWVFKFVNPGAVSNNKMFGLNFSYIIF